MLDIYIAKLPTDCSEESVYPPERQKIIENTTLTRYNYCVIVQIYNYEKGCLHGFAFLGLRLCIQPDI